MKTNQSAGSFFFLKNTKNYSRLNLKQYVMDFKTFLEINLTFLSSLFISYFNILAKFAN